MFTGLKQFRIEGFKWIIAIYLLVLPAISMSQQNNTMKENDSPVRLVVAGISHGHAPWVFNRKDKKDIEIVGIYEPNQALAKKYATEYKLDDALFYTDLDKMLLSVKPRAAVAFGSIYDHMAVVEACAPKGIHVMVEKPLATNLTHAKKMQALAKKHNIFLLTNYETSWYPVTEKTYQLVNDSNFVGKLHKAVFHHGHQGPQEIGVSKEFFDWLTDPVQNGGGALVDFGCYGANIMTYLMKGQQPLSVTAVTRQFKPSIYPKVDDEATIIVNYPDAQCIIQASWNWPFNRKDMEVYGDRGTVITYDNTNMELRSGNNKPGKITVTTQEVPVYTDPFEYFVQVIQGKIKVEPNSLYSLENNMMVVRILEAARTSAKTGRTIKL